jgi:hypothetical protein
VAVVFISPAHRQKMFFMGITMVFLLILIIISLGVFLAKPSEVSTVLVFNKPKVNIDMGVFSSDQFKNLQPFTQMEIQYSYKATTKDGKSVSGFISANSKDEAQSVLTGRGLNVSELKEAEIGRDNPFIPYYQPAPAPVVTQVKKTTTKTVTSK